ncbi:hypothetical protein LX66_0955 [Chitinophaga japonensis]|uniref:DUF2281 domain-containing protein n=2 Tax=Chitinophaga japonensis TaxID=104662 RepID=A0A562TDE3_CHIJA|nr:hypothetical protein LX66_0955 [Chitinophaga japonensis]
MAHTADINEILYQVKQLDKEDQLSLLEKIVSLLKKEEAQAQHPVTISSLAGLGAEIWRNIDIDQYLENERQW